MGWFSLIAGAGAVAAAAAGVVYTNFSCRVMPRLATLGSEEAIETMKGFNRNAVQVPFMTVFFGGAAASSALIFFTMTHDGPALAHWAATAGSCLYLSGFVLTITHNVSWNRRLEVVIPGTSGAADLWQRYLVAWTRSNSLRAACSLLGAGALSAAVLIEAMSAS